MASSASTNDRESTYPNPRYALGAAARAAAKLLDAAIGLLPFVSRAALTVTSGPIMRTVPRVAQASVMPALTTVVIEPSP